jgi:phenylacetate-CoA ligase
MASAVPPSVFLGRRFRRQRRFLREAQWWPMERLRDYQLSRLQSICRLAYDRTAFYRRQFDSRGFDPRGLRDPEDLAGLPTIDAQTVRDHLEDMCAVPPDSWGVDYVSTGGTGGRPLRFYIGAERSATEYAHLVASWERIGFRLGTPLAVLRGRNVNSNGNGVRHEHDPLLRHHYYSNFHTSDSDLGAYVEHIRGLGPVFLHVYPSSVDALVRFVIRSGVEPPRNVRGIIAESEVVYPEQRWRVERVLGCRYFACYGHSEKLVAGCECEHSDNLHVWPTYGYFELLDEDGRRVTRPGQRGEIVGTGFINRVMPFIRYRTGDYATYLGEYCDRCGRQHPVITDVRGHRVQEMLIAADGSEISWTAVNLHDDTFDGVRRFQFYQDTPGRAVLRLVPVEGAAKPNLELIERRVARRLDGRLTVDLVLTDEIQLTQQGKMIYVDQRVPRNGAAGSTAELAEAFT